MNAPRRPGFTLYQLLVLSLLSPFLSGGSPATSSRNC